MVVKAPDAVAAGGLEHVLALHAADDAQVGRDDAEAQRGEVRGPDDVEDEEAAQKGDKGQLVARAVVDARGVAKGFRQVRC